MKTLIAILAVVFVFSYSSDLFAQNPDLDSSVKDTIKEAEQGDADAQFMLCNRSKDAATILAVAEILPKNVIEEDEQLQMIYDMAEMRAG